MHYLKLFGGLMIKFKEILFLKSLKRVGKASIYGKYWKILTETNDLDELISNIQLMESKFSPEYLQETKNKVEELYLNIKNSDISVITIFDENYPKQLKVMEKKKPLILYVKGNVKALTKKNIAIIGTRKPSDISQEFEEKLVKNIVNTSDRAVVSGLALGCDKIAHKTTVDENKTTIAILPSGVNVITPASNKKLAESIIDTGGSLVSEYEPDAKAFKRTYIERDQIVAAFSDATFVVECSVKSGTMHTVNFAKEYGKQIFSYLPEDRPKDSYDGNMFILNNDENTLKVESIEKFLVDLKNITENNEKLNNMSNSVQPTLDSF